MRKASVVGVLAGLTALVVACGAPTSSVDPATTNAPTGGEPSANAEGASDAKGAFYFEGTFNPATETLDIVYRSPTGEILREPTESEIESSQIVHPDSVCTANFQNSLPYATTGTAGVYLHTVNAQWVSPEIRGGVCPMNLFANPVCSYTAWIDSVTIVNQQAGESIGILKQPSSGGGNSTAWTCTGAGNGTGVVGSPFVPPCSFQYSAALANTSTLCGMPTVKPWVFHLFGFSASRLLQPNLFTFRGRVSGDQPSS